MLILPGVIAAGRQLAPPEPPDPREPHRYWRIQIDQTLGSYTTIGSIQMLAEVGQTDRCTGGTPIESGHDGSSVPANAFDQNLASYWRGAANGYIGYDFGSGNEQAIRVFKIAAPKDDTKLSEMPSVFRIQFSDDGTEWYTFFTLTNQIAWQTGEVRTYIDEEFDYWTAANSLYGDHLHWQLVMYNSAAGTQLSISEMQYRAYPTGSDQATGGTASATNNSGSSFLPSKAFDDDNGTSWQSAFSAATDQWGIVLSYQFAAAVYVGEFAIRAGGTTNQTPRAGMVRYSDDGTNWTMGWYFNTDGWATNETKSFPDPDFFDGSNGVVEDYQGYIEVFTSSNPGMYVQELYVEALTTNYAGVDVQRHYIEILQNYEE